jgi:hypothetical protein
MRTRISIWGEQARVEGVRLVSVLVTGWLSLQYMRTPWWELERVLERVRELELEPERERILELEPKKLRALMNARTIARMLAWSLEQAQALDLEQMEQQERVWTRMRELERVREWARVRNSSTPRENIIIASVLCFLSERAQAEWVGDLREMRRAWQEQGLAPLSINMRTLRVVVLLLLAQLYCWFYDRTSARYWGKL